jgi:hypothetical protein
MSNDARPSVGEEEVNREGQALREILAWSPTTLSASELIRTLGADMSDPIGSVEPWRRAIRELGRCGLLRIEGESVFPTAAAIRAYELLEE